MFGVDLRSTGSGNPGATNVGRALGPRWAVLVGVLDVLKGFVPAVLFGTFVGQTSGEVAGLAAVVGHITSPLLKGRGGKGVATTLGAILGVQPLLAVPVLLAFGIGVAVWHRVGLGAVLGAVALIVSGLVGWAAGWLDEADMWFAVVLGMLVLVRHQRNLREAWASFRSARLTLSTVVPPVAGVHRAVPRRPSAARARPSVVCHGVATRTAHVEGHGPGRAATQQRRPAVAVRTQPCRS